jgi:arylsulfatase A-like enzyme
MRRDDCLDIAHEVDILFGQFIDLLKQRGVYDNSTIVLLSDHGMENVKDQSKGYEVIDLRKVLGKHGFVYNEDYREAGGAGSVVWCTDPAKVPTIEKVLEEYTVNDPELGATRPLTVINRQEMMDGEDFGANGRVLPKELYSEYWINHQNEPDGHLWPDLFVFPLNRYNICTHGQVLAGGFNPTGVTLGNIPDSVQMGFPAYHGGLSTGRIPLVLKAPAGYPGYRPGGESAQEVWISDIAPTIYEIMGWSAPGCVDGKPLPAAP